jgi:hypothetical protein
MVVKWTYFNGVEQTYLNTYHSPRDFQITNQLIFILSFFLFIAQAATLSYKGEFTVPGSLRGFPSAFIIRLPLP